MNRDLVKRAIHEALWNDQVSWADIEAATDAVMKLDNSDEILSSSIRTIALMGDLLAEAQAKCIDLRSQLEFAKSPVAAALGVEKYG